jgi:hypothetical protein
MCRGDEWLRLGRLVRDVLGGCDARPDQISFDNEPGFSSPDFLDHRSVEGTELGRTPLAALPRRPKPLLAGFKGQPIPFLFEPVLDGGNGATEPARHDIDRQAIDIDQPGDIPRRDG